MDPRRWHGIEKMRQKAGSWNTKAGIEKMRQKAGSWHREDETEDLSLETLKTGGWKLKYETVSLCKFRYKCVAFVDGKSTIGEGYWYDMEYKHLNMGCNSKHSRKRKKRKKKK